MSLEFRLSCSSRQVGLQRRKLYPVIGLCVTVLQVPPPRELRVQSLTRLPYDALYLLLLCSSKTHLRHARRDARPGEENDTHCRQPTGATDSLSPHTKQTRWHDLNLRRFFLPLLYAQPFYSSSTPTDVLTKTHPHT